LSACGEHKRLNGYGKRSTLSVAIRMFLLTGVRWLVVITALVYIGHAGA
jgi:hypothetical protein